MLSFTFPVFPAIVFLLFLGPKSTGKTEAMNILSRLVRCGHKAGITAAALGDFTATRRVIWFIDQANKLHPELIQTLVDSYKHDAKRIITDVENRGKPHEFPTFGPKAFAAHNNFDPDLKDRCIQITTLPSPRPVEPLLAED